MTRLLVCVGVSGILVGWLWNGPLVWGHYMAALAVLWMACGLVDGARIWRASR